MKYLFLNDVKYNKYLSQHLIYYFLPDNNICKLNYIKNGKQPKQGKRGQAKPKQTTTAQQLEQLSVRVCEMCRNSIKATFYG